VTGGEAVLIVRDTGIGMTTDELERAFDRFFRAQRARALAPGSGLGLAIVRGIAQAHGGSVTVTSRPDHGTTVEVRLPLSTPQRAGAAVREQA
jgi:signal transduction histidine kinase